MSLVERDLVGGEALHGFRSALHGELHMRGGEGYDAARAAWNLTIDHRPEYVVVAATESDVVETLRFAATHGLPVGVQTTGHGQPRAVEGGILLVVRHLNSVEIDRNASLARIGGGAIWQEVIDPAVALGLVPISGSSPGVGVVGYTIGGGFGLLSRKHGLASDTVLSFRIVLSSGEAVSASPSENADLFWAVLGGGGSFGVITEITMRLVPHEAMFGGSVMFDASLASSVYPAYVKWTKTLPDEVSSSIVMMSFPPVPFIPEFLHGRSMVIVVASALAEPLQAEEWLEPIRSMPGAEFDSFQPMTYDRSAEIFRDPVDPLPANGRGVLLLDLDDEALSVLLDAIGPAQQSPNLMIQLRHLDGAIARGGVNRNATGDRRRAKYLIYFLGVPMGPVTPAAMASHAEGVFAAMAPYVLSRGPLNWVGEGDVSASHLRDVFSSEELERLECVKKAVDPANRFCFAGVGLS